MEFCKKLWVMDFGKTHRGRKRKNSMDVVRSENAQVNCYSITSSRRLPSQLPWREEFWHSLPKNKQRVTKKIESPVTMPVFPLTSNWTTLDDSVPILASVGEVSISRPAKVLECRGDLGVLTGSKSSPATLSMPSLSSSSFSLGSWTWSQSLHPGMKKQTSWPSER